jgi:hypothetical protein
MSHLPNRIVYGRLRMQCQTRTERTHIAGSSCRCHCESLPRREPIHLSGSRDSHFRDGGGAYSGVAQYLGAQGDVCPVGVAVDGQGGTLSACTDGSGDIFLFGSVSSAITAGNGEATGPVTGTEPGCEASPQANTAQPSCTGDVLTLSALPYINTVAPSNSLTANMWGNETVAGAIDGSGPNGQLQSTDPTYLDRSGTATIQNTWTSNSCDPLVATPVCGL